MEVRPTKCFWSIGLFLVFPAFIQSFSGSTSFAQIDSLRDDKPCVAYNTTFRDGEELVYKIYYNWNFVWLPAGEVTFSVKDLGHQYYISAFGRTYSSYEWFFKVRDHYQVFIDKATLLPITAIRNVEEGNYRIFDKMQFDQEGLQIHSLRGKSPEVAEPATYSISHCMHDILSVMYYMRNLNYDRMEVGEKVPITIFMDKEEWPLKVRYMGEESGKRIKGLGKFNTIKLSPAVIAGYVFDEDTEMMIWASDDANRVPLLIESPVSVGSIKAVLKDYRNLRTDLNRY